ncbi:MULTISPECIES: NupC/NupG family nucleoside CNT transporter [unclassified Providencia]|uniref:NupC/NupG family nucleoside CNT transporter n=1 Tax=unclassified Providencia TaxID=2633465 RepID=UPI00234B4EC8|nr:MULTISPECIES: nucleoside transporter C-terminal domain-containing protein [unclassified Providencia]
MKYLIFFFSLIFVFLIAYLLSFSKKNIKHKLPSILTLLTLEIIVASTMLNTTIGLATLDGIASGIHYIINYANKGIDFVFGDVSSKTSMVFVVVALLPLIFICSIIGIFKYIGALDLIINTIGFLINKISKVGKLESFAAISAVIVGMMPAYVSIKDYIPRLSKAQMYTIAACTVSTVDIALLGAYTQMVEPRYVFIGVSLNFFSTFIIVSIINPSEPTNITTCPLGANKGERGSFFEVLTDHMQDAFKLILAIVPIIIGFVALISMLNDVFLNILGISFQGILGYIFSPLAFILGSSWDESVTFGTIIATKILSNEFVAMIDYMKLTSITPRTDAIMSVFLISFANFGSIGMIIGCVTSISREHGKMIASNSFRLIVGSTLVSCLSATIVGIFV